MRGVLEILIEEPGGMPAREVLQRLESMVPPTPLEDSVYPNRPNVRRREKTVRFATIPLVKAGWLRKDKGTWQVTEEGQQAYEKYVDPDVFIREAVQRYKSWRRSQPQADDLDDLGVDETADTVSILEEAQESAWSEISAYLMAMNPYEFQDLVAALLKAMGYHVAYVSPPGPDHGLDVLAYTDPLGATGPRIKVQVKRRADKATVESIRAFMALLGAQDVGLFVCSGGFTRDAQVEVRSQQNRRLALIDLDRLFELWVEHYDRIPEIERQLLPLRPVHFLDPRD
jgi:restriction system protein